MGVTDLAVWEARGHFSHLTGGELEAETFTKVSGHPGLGAKRSGTLCPILRSWTEFRAICGLGRSLVPVPGRQ